ncbi:hypothetical protein F5Y03DRAFT_230700 [Xylaria venustula]|nr:hypothetical protein F5Y03DRAFT_230700 [Xylaria venustula]
MLVSCCKTSLFAKKMFITDLPFFRFTAFSPSMMPGWLCGGYLCVISGGRYNVMSHVELASNVLLELLVMIVVQTPYCMYVFGSQNAGDPRNLS